MSERHPPPLLIRPEVKSRFAALLTRQDLRQHLHLADHERAGVDTVIALAQEAAQLRGKLDDALVDNDRLARAAIDSPHGHADLRHALRAARDERDIRRLNEQELRVDLEALTRALAELVALKTIKEGIESGILEAVGPEADSYMSRKDAAWAAARAALKASGT